MSTSPAKLIVPVYDKAVVALSTLLTGGSFVDKLVAKSLLLPIDLENDLRRQIRDERPDEAARQILNILRKGTDETMIKFLDVLKQFSGGHELLKLLGEEVSPLPEAESAPFEKRVMSTAVSPSTAVRASELTAPNSSEDVVGQSLLGITGEFLPAEVALTLSATKYVLVFIDNNEKLKETYEQQKWELIDWLRFIVEQIQKQHVNIITIFVQNLKCAEKPKTTGVFVKKFCSVLLRLPKTTVESFKAEKENFDQFISDLMKVECDQIVITEGSCNVNFTVPGEGLIQLICSLSNPNNFTYLLELDSLAEIQIPGLEPFPLALLTRTKFVVPEQIDIGDCQPEITPAFLDRLYTSGAISSSEYDYAVACASYCQWRKYIQKLLTRRPRRDNCMTADYHVAVELAICIHKGFRRDLTVGLMKWLQISENRIEIVSRFSGICRAKRVLVIKEFMLVQTLVVSKQGRDQLTNLNRVRRTLAQFLSAKVWLSEDGFKTGTLFLQMTGKDALNLLLSILNPLSSQYLARALSKHLDGDATSLEFVFGDLPVLTIKVPLDQRRVEPKAAVNHALPALDDDTKSRVRLAVNDILALPAKEQFRYLCNRDPMVPNIGYVLQSVLRAFSGNEQWKDEFLLYASEKEELYVVSQLLAAGARATEHCLRAAARNRETVVLHRLNQFCPETRKATLHGSCFQLESHLTERFKNLLEAKKKSIMYAQL